MDSKSFRKWLGGSTIALATLGGGVVAVAAGGSSGSVGPDRVYGDDAFASASARVHIVRTGTGGTSVTLHMTGVDAEPGRTFGAHIHQSACGPLGSDAGGHYQHAGASGSLEEREVWLDFTINEAGNGHAMATRPWSVDETSPRSVIVHALPTDSVSGAAGPRLACIDLDGDHT